MSGGGVLSFGPLLGPVAFEAYATDVDSPPPSAGGALTTGSGAQLTLWCLQPAPGAQSSEGEAPGSPARPPGWHVGVCGCQPCNSSPAGDPTVALSCFSLLGTPPTLVPGKNYQAAIRAQSRFPPRAANGRLSLQPRGPGTQTPIRIFTRSFKLSLKWPSSHFLGHEMKGQCGWLGLEGIVRKCGRVLSTAGGPGPWVTKPFTG